MEYHSVVLTLRYSISFFFNLKKFYNYELYIRHSFYDFHRIAYSGCRIAHFLFPQSITPRD